MRTTIVSAKSIYSFSCNIIKKKKRKKMLPTVRIIRIYSLNNFLMPCTTELSIVIMKMKVTQSCPALCKPTDYTGVGSLSLLQGIFPTQGSNPGLCNCGTS